MISDNFFTTPLARQLIESVQAEELILQRIVQGVHEGSHEMVLMAANDLAALRDPSNTRDCAV